MVLQKEKEKYFYRGERKVTLISNIHSGENETRLECNLKRISVDQEEIELSDPHTEKIKCLKTIRRKKRTQMHNF